MAFLSLLLLAPFLAGIFAPTPEDDDATPPNVGLGGTDDPLPSGNDILDDLRELSDDNDGFIGSNDSDAINGGLGNDTLDMGDGENLALGGEGNDDILGGADVDVLIGEAGDDWLTGGEGGDFLEGGAGLDTVSGDGGADFLFGGADADVVSGGAGNDALVGGTGADRLDGGAGNDTIFSGTLAERDLTVNEWFDAPRTGALPADLFQQTAPDDGAADLIFGGDGNDFIVLGGGDQASGGSGGDTFVVLSTITGGPAVITDYNSAVDQLIIETDPADPLIGLIPLQVGDDVELVSPFGVPFVVLRDVDVTALDLSTINIALA